MSKVVIKEQQARDIALRVPESSCTSVQVQDDGLLHGDIEIDIDRAGLRRGKTETLVCILYAEPADDDTAETETATNEVAGEPSETESDKATETEADTDAAAEDPADSMPTEPADNEPADGDSDDTGSNNADDSEESTSAEPEGDSSDDEADDQFGDPVLADAERGHVATITTKVAVPKDELVKTVKVSLTKVFPDLGGQSVRIAAIPYRSKKPILAVLAALAVLAVIVGIIISNWGDPRAKKGYYDGKSQEDIQADLDSKVDWYSMEISVANAMITTEGQTEVEARIENVVNNHCDQKVKMYPDGHPEDVLFESGAIRPGEYIQTVNLSHPLPVGRHNITVEFQGYDQSPTLISNEGQFLGHDTFGASCAAQVTIEVRPAGVAYEEAG